MQSDQWSDDKVVRGKEGRPNEMAGAFCASGIFHFLMFLILSTTSTYYPTIGTITRLDIFWVTPSSESPVSPESPVVSATAATAPGQDTGQPKGDRHLRSRSPSQQEKLPGEIPPPTAAKKSSVSPPLPPVTGADSPSTGSQTSNRDQREEPVSLLLTRKLSKARERRRTSAEPASVAQKETAPRTGEANQREESKEQKNRANDEKERKRQADQLAALKKLEDEKAERESIAEQARRALESEQQRLQSLQSLRGDLKLVIAGDTVQLSATFREYPRSRRSKVLRRSQLRPEQTIVPVTAQIQDATREAVIETAREGIYVFRAESDRPKGARAKLTLKLFESGANEKIVALGTRTISARTVLFKILMPEAVLWDDETAFTGTLEDSESVTKFNVLTGLNWKEFND